MNYNSMTRVAADAYPVDRAKFVSNTYSHLAGALLVFMGLEYVLLKTAMPALMMSIIGMGSLAWLAVIGLFMAASWASTALANNESSRALQFAGLGLYTLAQAVIFLPIISFAVKTSGTEVIGQAAAITLALVAGLTTIVFTTRTDFTCLGGIIKVSCWVALGCIVAAAIFGFTLGILFSGAMVVVAAAAILYSTSNVLHHYRTDQHVAAALALLSSVLTLFWYILRILLSLGRRN